MKIIATKKTETGILFIVEKYNNYYYANLYFGNGELEIIDYRVILTADNVKYSVKNEGFELTYFGLKTIN